MADSQYSAKLAASKVKVEYEELPGVFSIDEAIKQQKFYDFFHKIESGNAEESLKNADRVVEGAISMGGQEQFYFETNVTLAVPTDNDMIIYSSTQNANKTQKTVASVLGLPMNRVVCKVGRIGGGFGGKETRNIEFSAAAAVAAYHENKPVRLVLERDLDMQISGYFSFFFLKFERRTELNEK